MDALRNTVYEDLDKGLLLGLTMTIHEMEELGNPVHHMTRDAQDYLLKRGIHENTERTGAAGGEGAV